MRLLETQCPLLHRFEAMYMYSNFDLEGWPWPFTTQKCAAPWDTHACQISSCYLQYCKFWPLTLKDDLDLSSLKMCSSMRYTCMPNIKLLSSIFKKLWPMLKFSDGRNIWHLTLKNDLDFHLLPLKIFSSKRYTCIKKNQVAIFNI
jgi:hypothetical protein